MTQPTTLDPVRRSITVRAPIDRAFAVFTDGLDRWWPREHHIGDPDLAEAVLEPRAGGRWYERGVDGSECEWGTVLAWEPPHRLVLSWQIGADWRYDPDASHASEIEARFIAEGPEQTRVEFEHRAFERHGAGGEKIAAAVGSPEGWDGTLENFAKAVEGVENAASHST
jgi:uncharacterized protein YndB with AHSA1/START domain